jgi:hypothetical protein
MKRLGLPCIAVLITAGFLVSLVGTAQASPRGRLGGPEAKHYSRVALEHGFGIRIAMATARACRATGGQSG